MSNNPMTSAQFIKLMDRRLRKVYENEWAEIDTMIGKLFGEMPSDSQWEEFYGVGALPDVQPWAGKLEFASVAPGYLTRIEHGTFALGTAFEKELIDDKKYKVLDNRVGMMTESMARVREKSGVGMFANAFSTALPFMTSEEGLSLCNTAHTTKAGVSTTTGFGNYGTSTLSKTSIAATWIAMRKFKNDIGARIEVNPDTLIVPETLYFAACEAVGYDPQTGASSDMDPDSANRKINTQYKRFNVIPYRRLDDYTTSAWFMADSKKMKKFLLWMDREKPNTDMWVDRDTWSLKYAVRGRWSCGFTDWRWVYGHNPS